MDSRDKKDLRGTWWRKGVDCTSEESLAVAQDADREFPDAHCHSRHSDEEGLGRQLAPASIICIHPLALC